MTTATSYERGLVEVADGTFAYLQPDGSWGWSNAGLVVGDGESVLVDTLFDLHLTQTMLDDLAPHTATRPIRNVVNTHANGDHCFGNQLVAGPGVEFIASAAASSEMQELPPSLLAAVAQGPLEGNLGAFIRHAFGPFDFEGIDAPAATIEFTGSHQVDAGNRNMELLEVGPAHTQGDVIAWLPDEKVVFGGDILFIEGTPVMWAGPVGGWIAAIDTILALDPQVIVPGHGPLATTAQVHALRDYLELLQRLVVERHRAGMTVEDAIADIDARIDDSPYRDWTDRERIVVNVQSIWRELEPTFVTPNILETLQQMADRFAAHRSS